MSVHLTKTIVDGATFDPSKGKTQYLWDNEVRGFGLSIHPSGNKTYVLRYRFHGRQRIMKLGAVGEPTASIEANIEKVLTGKEYRNTALTKLVDVKNGIDPLEAKRWAREQELGKLTLSQVFEKYIEKPVFKRKSTSHQLGLKQKLRKNVLPKLGRYNISDIRRRDLKNLLEGIVDSGKQALGKQVLAYTRILFNFAVDQEFIEFSPCDRISLDLDLAPRDRVLTEKEIKAFWEACDDMRAGKVIQYALKFQLITAQRIGEIVKARWEHVDLESKVWTIPRENAKNRKHSHKVPLTDLAFDVITELKSYDDGSGWLCPSPVKKGGHVTATSVTRAIWQEREKGGALAGIAPFSPHDLRRTVATMLSHEEVERQHIKQILNHTEHDVTAAYVHDDYLKPKRRYLDLWSTKLEHILSSEHSKPSNVVMIGSN